MKIYKKGFILLEGRGHVMQEILEALIIECSERSYSFHASSQRPLYDPNGELISIIPHSTYWDRMIGARRVQIFMAPQNNQYILQARVIGHNGVPYNIFFHQTCQECGWVSTDAGNSIQTLVLTEPEQVPNAINGLEARIYYAIKHQKCLIPDYFASDIRFGKYPFDW